MTLREILGDVHAIDSALAEFEERYGLLSSSFFAWYQQGNEPEEQSWVLDFTEWSGLYRSKQRLLELYQQRLAEVSSQANNDFNRIIQQTRQAVTA